MRMASGRIEGVWSKPSLRRCSWGGLTVSAVDLYLSPVLVLGAALGHVAAYPTTDPVAGFSVGWAATIPETPHDMVHTCEIMSIFL